jgi:predicted Zn-dependent protease
MEKMIKRITVIFVIITVSAGFTFSQNLDFDIKQGKEAAQKVAVQMGVDTTSNTAVYLKNIGDHLVSNLEDPLFGFNFHMIDSYQPNAFALPGGYIYVTRGILVLLNNEDELAGIMGHEIVHSQNRHSYKAAKKNILPAILKAPGNVIGLVNEDLGKLINAPIDITSGLNLAKYGREQETEADSQGALLAARSGYQPEALAVALDNLSKSIQYITGKEEKFSYFSDHPFTPDRVENIGTISKDLEVSDQKPIAASNREFMEKLKGIIIGEDPAQGVVNGNSFYHADLDLDITFPEGWQISNNTAYVAAVEPKERAQVYLIVVAGGGEPKELGEEFIGKFVDKYRVESFRSEEFEINGYPAFVFGVNEMSRGKVNNSTITWVKKGGITYQVVGAGLKEYEKDFDAVAASIQPLSKENKEKVTGIILEIAYAKEGETLREMSVRTENVLKTDFTALINNLDEEEKLASGQAVKIGIRKVYKPGK